MLPESINDWYESIALLSGSNPLITHYNSEMLLNAKVPKIHYIKSLRAEGLLLWTQSIIRIVKIRITIALLSCYFLNPCPLCLVVTRRQLHHAFSPFGTSQSVNMIIGGKYVFITNSVMFPIDSIPSLDL